MKSALVCAGNKPILQEVFAAVYFIWNFNAYKLGMYEVYTSVCQLGLKQYHSSAASPNSFPTSNSNPIFNCNLITLFLTNPNCDCNSNPVSNSNPLPNFNAILIPYL